MTSRTLRSVIRPLWLSSFALALSVIGREAIAQVAPGAEIIPDREIVVTATTLETAREEVGSAVTVISREELASRKENTVVEVLRATAGVDVVNSGGPGGNSAVFIRGANAEHTLVLIDGIEANNPVTTGRSFNLANLSLENVEKIEILRGPQSSLYGSDALGGVINIITKKGRGTPAGSVSVMGGSYDTFTGSADISGGGESVNYSLGVTQQEIGGTSAANVKDGNREDDSFSNTGVSARLGVSVAEGVNLNYFTRYNDTRSDIDNQGGVGGDDINRVFLSENFFTRGEADLRFLDGTLTSKLGVNYSTHEFRDNNDPDPQHPLDRLRSDYDGSLLEFNWVNSYALCDAAILTLGAETEEERADSTYRSESSFGPYSTEFYGRSARTNGVFGQAQLTYGERFFATIGARVDDHSRFGSKTTWRVAPTYHIKESNTRLLGSVGTGYKAPSLYQLFSEYGRQDLNAEESVGWDIGIEQGLFEKSLIVGATFFRNDFDNLISFDPQTFNYTNIAEANTRGVELMARYSVSSDLTLGVDYTYTDSEDESNGLPLLRRARHKFKGLVTYVPVEGLSFTATPTYVGGRDDQDFSSFPPVRRGLKSYWLLDVAGAYDIAPNMQLFTRLDNLLDEEYEDVLGYGTLGFAAYGGVKLSF